MKKLRMAFGAGIIAAASALFFAIPAYAGSVSTVSIRIDKSEEDMFQVGAYIDDSAVDVTVPENDSTKYHVAEYSFNNNSKSYFSTSTTPVLTVTLETDEDYTFSLTKASEVVLTGDTKPEYKAAYKREDSTELDVEISLTGLDGKAGSIEFADWDVNRNGKAEILSYGGTSHQIQLYKDGKKYSMVIEVPKTGDGNQVIDLSRYFMTAGNYTFAVRQYNEDTHTRGPWYTVENTYTVSEDLAEQNRGQYGYESRDGYGWKKDSTGWWYLTPGGYPKNEWIRDNQHWFWFDEDGYMVTGWHLIDGKWYYFAPNGEMQADQVTPDGYTLGDDGAMV